MKNSFIDEKGRKISVQFSKSEVVDVSSSNHTVSDAFLGGTLFASVAGNVNITLIDDDVSQVLAVEAGHSLYRVKKVFSASTTATGLKIFI